MERLGPTFPENAAVDGAEEIVRGGGDAGDIDAFPWLYARDELELLNDILVLIVTVLFLVRMAKHIHR